jgi:hypothetical protein
MKTIALDIDLNRIHAWSSASGQVCYNAPVPPLERLAEHDRILVEVASPFFYMARYNKGEVTNRMKWAIFNGIVTGQIFHYCQMNKIEDRLLVSPSSEWTLGYPEDIRIRIAGVQDKNNHDLRECQSMLFFHGRNPERWKPLPEYLSGFSKAKGAKG